MHDRMHLPADKEKQQKEKEQEGSGEGEDHPRSQENHLMICIRYYGRIAVPEFDRSMKLMHA